MMFVERCAEAYHGQRASEDWAAWATEHKDGAALLDWLAGCED